MYSEVHLLIEDGIPTTMQYVCAYLKFLAICSKCDDGVPLTCYMVEIIVTGRNLVGNFLSVVVYVVT